MQEGQDPVQESATEQLNTSGVDAEKLDASMVNRTISTNNQTNQFQTARIVANNLINQDMNLSLIDDS